MTRTLGNRFTTIDPKALRIAPRRLAAIPAKLASTAHGHLACSVDNLSRAGARLQLWCRLHRGEHVLLTLQGMAPSLTQVAWSIDGACGLEFADPLHVAVLDRLLAMFPQLESSDRVRTLADL